MHKLKTLSLLVAALTLSACGSGNSDEKKVLTVPVVEPEVVVEPGPFTFAFKTTGGDEPEYLVTQESITTEALNADGKGIEQQGWNYFYPVGNTLFIVGYEHNEATSYKVDANKNVAKLATFEFTNTLEMFGSVDDKVLLATDAPRDGNHTKRTLYTVNAETGLVTSKVSYSIHDVDTGTKGEGTVGYPTALIQRGDLLFISFHKMDDAGSWGTPEADNAFVAIYDYPLIEGATPKNIIADNRTSNIGVNGNIGLIKTDNGDIYSMSNGSIAAGFSPGSTKPSAMLRINNNETEFDANYFFDIEVATNGGKIFWFDYVGDNKAIARIITDDSAAESWGAYTKNEINHKLVIIDLVAQTITDVAGVPLHHKRWTSPIEIMDGKVFVSIEEKDSAFVYEVDIASATATKGVEITGKTIKGFYDLYH